ncbi:MAG: tetraacyldisaccharide 4'-kinase [Planctomycetaceae bacterium]|nr:tetraacyldisaccharide 4'-kinase [Planctomycetaceae bacterium]
MTHDQIHQILSGHRRDVSAALMRAGLSLAAPLYGAAISLRNRLFDRKLLKTAELNVPVISVGNVTTGGTGKTPVVAWLTHQLTSLGYRPGLLSRGYKSLDPAGNDEKRVLELLCPDIPHIQNRSRFAGGQKLLQEHDVNVAVLDDGFQHRQLHRDVDLVLIDATNPWGFGHLLPRGLLRESLSGLRRASAILVTRCDQVDEAAITQIIAQAKTYTSVPILRTQFTSTGFSNSQGENYSVGDAQIDWSHPHAFCGIGNPIGFQKTLSSLAGNEVPLSAFPDHFHYSRGDLDELSAAAETPSVWLTTLKDLVKINQPDLNGVPLLAVEIRLEFLDSSQPLLDILASALHS